MCVRHNLSSISYRSYNHFLNEYSHQFQGNSIPIDPWSQSSLWCLHSLTESISPARVSTDGFLVWRSCWAPTRSCCTSICNKHSPWRRRKFTKKNHWTLLNTCWSFGIAILYFFSSKLRTPFGQLMYVWCPLSSRPMMVVNKNKAIAQTLNRPNVVEFTTMNLQTPKTSHIQRTTTCVEFNLAFLCFKLIYLYRYFDIMLRVQ